MSKRKAILEAKLKELSRDQAPDGWDTLKERVQLAKTSERNDTLTTRSAKLMNKKYKWISAVSAAVIVLIVTAALAFQLLPDAKIGRLEAGQQLTLDKGTIFVNSITRTGGKIGMPPDADIVDLTWQDLPAIFGREPIPELPEGMKLEGESISAMIFRSGGVFLMNGITFSANPQDPATARVVFDLNDKGELPLTDCVFGSDKTSVLNDVEMMLGVETVEGEDGPFDMYTAQFVANNIGYRIRATNMTGDTFISIIEAIVKG